MVPPKGVVAVELDRYPSFSQFPASRTATSLTTRLFVCLFPTRLVLSSKQLSRMQSSVEIGEGREEFPETRNRRKQMIRLVLLLIVEWLSNASRPLVDRFCSVRPTCNCRLKEPLGKAGYEGLLSRYNDRTKLSGFRTSVVKESEVHTSSPSGV